jgi:predicted deacylase
MSELVVHATHVVDLHSGALHRDNLPQIRGCLDDPRTVELARAFEVPVVLHAELRDGSLRAALSELDIPAVVYEAGEALRFDEVAIRAGVRGVLGVMRWLQMLPQSRQQRPVRGPLLARGSHWVRAPESGVLRTSVKLGSNVEKGAVIGIVSDPLGEAEQPVITPHSGVVIGRTNLPLVNEGDALFHVALFQKPEVVANHVEAFQESLDPDADDATSELDPDH